MDAPCTALEWPVHQKGIVDVARLARAAGTPDRARRGAAPRRDCPTKRWQISWLRAITVFAEQRILPSFAIQAGQPLLRSRVGRRPRSRLAPRSPSAARRRRPRRKVFDEN